MIYLGMDVHRRTTTFCAINDEGEIVKRGKLPSSAAGWREMASPWDAAELRAALRGRYLTPPLRKWARRLIVKQGRQVAAVALTRRLLTSVHRMLGRGEAFNPHHPMICLSA